MPGQEVRLASGFSRHVPEDHALCPECGGEGNLCDPSCGSNCSPLCEAGPGSDPRCGTCGGDGTVAEGQ